MASVKQILGVILISALLIGGLAWWIEQSNQSNNIVLSDDVELGDEFNPETLEIYNDEITNTMNPTAIMQTNKGIIEIELYEDLMPITTGNFIKLSEEGFYDGIKFHRIIDNFMIQAGDPNTKGDDTSIYGTGGPGYTIQDEFVENELLSNERGTIAMANTGQPDSGGSQFFINTVNNTGLDFNNNTQPQSKHPVFGRVIKGLDVVDDISNIETNPMGLPEEPVIIQSVTIQRGG